MSIMSFKVTDFGTNRKHICDFLLVINSNLPPILHRLTVNYLLYCTVSKLCLIMCQIFASDSGRCTLTPSLVVIPCEYRHKRHSFMSFMVWLAKK